MAKGVYIRKPFTEEHKENMRLSCLGRKFTEEHRKNMSLVRQGMKLSEEHRKNISKSHKGYKWTEEQLRKQRLAHLGENNAFYGKKHTEATKKRISGSRKGKSAGKEHPQWKGGKSFEPYPLGWTKTFKEQIRHRDNYKCQMCGVPEAECLRKLDVHHIDFDKDNISPSNLKTLCRSCHGKLRSIKNG